MIDLFRKAANRSIIVPLTGIPVISACVQREHFAETENMSKTCRALSLSLRVRCKRLTWAIYIRTYTTIVACPTPLYPPVVSRRRIRDWSTKAFARGRWTGPKTVEIARDVVANSPLWTNVKWLDVKGGRITPTHRPVDLMNARRTHCGNFKR